MKKRPMSLGSLSILFFALLCTMVLLMGDTYIVKAYTATSTIDINADGSITPAGAPITTSDMITYTLTDDITTTTGLTPLIGVKRSNIILDGNGHKITGPNSGYAIQIGTEGSYNITVKNVEISNFYVGIWPVGNTHDNKIAFNDIHDCTEAVRFQGGIPYNNLVVNNTFTNSGQKAVWLACDGKAHDNMICNNTITLTTSLDGIYLQQANLTLVANNTINTNNYGIYLKNSHNTTITGNTLTTGMSSIILMYGNLHNTTITKNTINQVGSEGAWSAAIKIDPTSSENNTIAMNTIQTVNIGILASKMKNSVISENFINLKGTGGCGIRVGESSYNEIRDNTIDSTTSWALPGIQLTGSSTTPSTYNNIINNSIGTNTGPSIYLSTGIFLQGSGTATVAYNNIIGNTIQHCSQNGIRLSESGVTANQFIDNKVINNAEGIRIESASGNTIYHNDFISNTKQVFQSLTDTSVNTWDNGYPSGGNYWSDYMGNDQYSGPAQNQPGADGFGDTPYTTGMVGTNKDNYPFMTIFFNQTGIGPDFTGTILTVDSMDYTSPVSFMWTPGSTHSFSYHSPLVVTANAKQYVWTSTTGLSTMQSETSFTVPLHGSVTGHYKTQYYLTVNTDPAEVLSLDPNAVSGEGWYDSEATATVNAVQNVEKTAGESRYDFRSWTGATPTGMDNQATVYMDGPKTATANYQLQFKVTFDQSGVETDFTGTVVTIDTTNYGVSSLPAEFWWDEGSSHTFEFQSPLEVTGSNKRYVWTSTSGLSTAQSGTLTISSSGSVTASYKKQYQITFTQTGLDNTATGTVATINGEAKTYGDLPFTIWADESGTVTYTYENIVSSSTSGKRFKLDTVTGPTSPIIVSGPVTVTGNYKTQYLLTVTTDPSGLSPQPTRDPEGEAGPVNGWWYDAATSVQLTAQAVTGYDFNYWKVDDVPQGIGVNPVTVEMAAPHTATAHYTMAGPGTVTITFSQSGVGSDFTGIVLQIDGNDYYVANLPVSFAWTIGSSHTFSYQSPLVVTANAKQYVWTSTTGLSTEQSGTIIASTSGSVTGNYKTQYYLTVNSDYGAPGGEGWYDDGGTAYATVNPLIVPVGPDTQYVFTHWSGDASGTTSPSDPITMDAPKTATANWKIQYQVTFAVNPTGSGTTSPSGTGWYDAGELSISASPNAGYTFSHWSATGSITITNPSSASTTATINEPGTITANFLTTATVSITITSDPTGSGYIKVDNVPYDTPHTFTWAVGETHKLEALSPVADGAGVRHVWVSWSDGGAQIHNYIVPSSSETVTANYKTQYLLTVLTDPSGLSPQPTRDPEGEAGPVNGWWYDAATSVQLTAESVSGYTFSHWDVDGASQGTDNPITVEMDAPHTATAYYARVPTVPEFLLELPLIITFGAMAAYMVRRRKLGKSKSPLHA